MENQVEIINRLKEYFKHRDDVVLAYLFGSRAKGRETEGRSDYDIAVYFKSMEGVFEYEEFPREYEQEAKMWTDLSSIAKTDVDLVVLNRASPNIVFSAINGTIVLVERDRNVYIELLLRSSCDAADFRSFITDYIKIAERSKSLTEEDQKQLERVLHFIVDEMGRREDFTSIDQIKYTRDHLARKAVERWIELVVGASIDTAKILLASRHQSIPQGYVDTLLALQYLEGFEKERAHWLAQMVKYRNFLAHEYLDLRYVGVKKFLDFAEANYDYLVKYARGVIKDETEKKLLA